MICLKDKVALIPVAPPTSTPYSSDMKLRGRERGSGTGGLIRGRGSLCWMLLLQ